VPTEKKQIFSTAADNQTSVEVHVLQGERPMAQDNKTLARFILDGIPPSPRGVPQVEVSFDVDANGILNVTALDKASGKKQTVKIEASTTLSGEEVDKLKQEAAAHAEEDKKKKKLIEIRNQAESLIYIAEKSLRESGKDAPAEIKSAIEKKIEELKTIKDGEDEEAIGKKVSELSTELQKIGESLYNKKDDNRSDGEAVSK
jgi:molecular chaperone DnaK